MQDPGNYKRKLTECLPTIQEIPQHNDFAILPHDSKASKIKTRQHIKAPLWEAAKSQIISLRLVKKQSFCLVYKYMPQISIRPCKQHFIPLYSIISLHFTIYVVKCLVYYSLALCLSSMYILSLQTLLTAYVYVFSTF